MRAYRWFMWGVVGVLLLTTIPAWAEEAAAAPSVADVQKSVGNMKVALDTVWVMIAAFLVFFMNLGFAAVESGFARAKNAVNIMSKNFIVFAVSSLGFWSWVGA